MTDLASKISSAASGTLKLPLDSYTLANLLQIKTPGLIVDGGGSTLDCAPDRTNFQVMAGNFTLQNFNVVRAGVLIEAQSHNASLIGCQVGQTAGSVTQAFKTMKGGSSPTIQSCNIGLTKTVSAYFEQDDVRVSDSTFKGTFNGAEYAIRGEVGGADGKSFPRGFILQGCTVNNPNGPKDTIGWRLGLGVIVSNCNIGGNFRFGQVPKAGGVQPTQPGQWCDASVSDTVFTSVGSPRSPLMIGQGCVFNGARLIFADYNLAAMAIDVVSTASTQGLTMRVSDIKTVPAFCSVAGMKRWVDLGGNSIQRYDKSTGQNGTSTPAPPQKKAPVPTAPPSSRSGSSPVGDQTAVTGLGRVTAGESQVTPRAPTTPAPSPQPGESPATYPTPQVNVGNVLALAACVGLGVAVAIQLRD